MYSDQFAPGFAGMVVGGFAFIGLLIFFASTRTWLIPLMIKTYYRMLNMVADFEEDIRATVEREREKPTDG